jgi:hypothetical protein
MKYITKRICKDCKNVDLFTLYEVDPVFGFSKHSLKIWNTPCSKCLSPNCESISHEEFIEKEDLDIWGNDPEAFFNQQDEEIELAKLKYLPMILEAIDESTYLKPKLHTLIEAVCVLLYDHTYLSEEGFTEEEDKERQSIADLVRPELIKRKDKVMEVTHMMDYLKLAVYPQIGVE